MSEPNSNFMVDEAEGNSKDGDANESDGEGELDEETMQRIASGNLPQDGETCLALNLVYQELLQAFMRHVEACLAQNREKQRSLEVELQNYSGEGSKKVGSRVPIRIYLTPYFRDAAGLPPPQNSAAREKAGELDPLVESTKKWTNGEKSLLLKAVGAEIFRVETVPLKNKLDYLTDTVNDTNNPEELTALTKEIRDLEKRIELVKNKVNVSNVTAKQLGAIDWTHISVSKFQGTRSPMECQLAWTGEVNPKINQDSWGPSEMSQLRIIAEKHGYRNWSQIAEELASGRTAFQCFEKYQTELNPNLTKKLWSLDDDAQLRDAVQRNRHGEFIPWEQVEGMLDGWTKVQAQTRWIRTLAPGLKRGRWAEDEDLLLLTAVEKCGPKDWTKIAECVPGRSDSQCRERWSTTMQTGQRIGPWTIEEDNLLLEGIKQFGSGQWSKICHLLEGRSATACKVRARRLLGKTDTNTTSKEVTSRSQLPEAIKSRVHGRSQQQVDRKQRLIDMYTRMVGHAPVMKAMETNVDKVLGQLPIDIQQIFQEKLAAVKESVAASNAEFPPMPRPKRRRNRKLQAAKRVRETMLERDQDIFRAILAEAEHMEPNNGAAPVKKLADLITSSKAVLPPTSGTLKAFRNLLSWQGSEYLFGTQASRRSLANTSFDGEAERAGTGVNAALTNKTTATMRGYLQERGDRDMPDDFNGGDSGSKDVGDDDTVPIDLLPDDESTLESFLALRDTFRQLFQWPAILATLSDDQD